MKEHYRDLKWLRIWKKAPKEKERVTIDKAAIKANQNKPNEVAEEVKENVIENVME